MTEQQLVEHCLDGNEIAQRQLYDLHHPTMLGGCMHYAGNRAEAQDMLQEGFIKVYNNLYKFEGKGSLEGWIRKVIVNTALEHLRKNRKRKDEQDIAQLENNLEAEVGALEKLHAEDIMKFIKILPVGYRMVFNLFAIEGYTHEEIARQLDISVNTSYSQYHRAKAALQKCLEMEKKAGSKMVG